MKNTAADRLPLIRNLWTRIVQDRRMAVAGWGALTLFSIYYAICRGFLVDETWYLRVMQRMLDGEILYRDIFLNVTPLSAYLTELWLGLFGVEMLAMRLLLVLCFLLTVAACLKIARQVGLGPEARLMLTISLCACMPPGEIGSGALYSPLAYLFFLYGFSAILKWKHEDVRSLPHDGYRTLIMAGVMSGLSFASKQNIGIISIGLAGLIVLTTEPRLYRLRPLLVTWCAFFLVSAGALIPVWFSGGWMQFLDYGFWNKTSYLQYGEISYWTAFYRLFDLIASPGDVGIVRQLGREVISFLPLLAGLALGLSRTLSKSNTHALPLMLFVGAVFLCAYPRFDYIHLSMTVPPAIIGLVYAWPSFRARLPIILIRSVQAAVIAWLTLWGWYAARDGAVWLLSGDYRMANLPHYRGLLMHSAWHDKVARMANDIRQNAVDDHPFILGAYSGFYYLLTDLKNPTPFDLPMKTSMGRHGIGQVMEAIEQGRIQQALVYSRPDPDFKLRPVELEELIRSTMKEGAQFGDFTAYLRP